MKESDLYLPVKEFLENQGYEVKSEIQDCDVLAVRKNESPVVVELKLSLNLNLILQAVDRLKLTSSVYIGVPLKSAALRCNKRRITRLLRMLGIGLIVIDTTAKKNQVKVIADPGDYRPRVSKVRQTRLLGEFAHRVGDPNQGGMEKRHGIMTAYRQQAMRLALHLEQKGPNKASVIAAELGEPKARDILYRNVYGWFERIATGTYQLSPRGRKEINRWQD